MYVELKTGEVYEQPADIVVLAAFTFTNNRLLMLSKIGKQYDPKFKNGVGGKEFKEKSIHYANRNLQVWYTGGILAWSFNYMDLILFTKTARTLHFSELRTVIPTRKK